MSEQLCLKWNYHTSTFNHLLEKLYLENTYSDVTVACHGKFYSVHRFVLSNCSEYFEAIFNQSNYLDQGHPFIIVHDVEQEQLETLLCYMYKGQVNVPQQVLPKLMKAAELFKIKGLAVPESNDTANNILCKNTNKRSSTSASPPSKSSKNTQDTSKESSVIVKDEITNIYTSELSISSNDLLHKTIIGIKDELIGEAEDTGTEVDGNVLLNPEKRPVETSIKRIESLQCSWDVNQDVTQSSSDEMNDSYWENSKDLQDDSLTLQPQMAMTVLNECITMMKSTAKSEEKKHKYQCQYCQYCTSRNCDLIRHKRTHTGEKPYVCTYCPFKAADKTTMRGHILRHTGEKPYSCDMCSFSSSRKHNLNIHKQAKHPDSSLSEAATES